jgi:lipoprotein NlpI
MKAIQRILEALKINPNFAEVYNNIGLYQAEQGDLTEA